MTDVKQSMLPFFFTSLLSQPMYIKTIEYISLF